MIAIEFTPVHRESRSAAVAASTVAAVKNSRHQVLGHQPREVRAAPSAPRSTSAGCGVPGGHDDVGAPTRPMPPPTQNPFTTAITGTA